MNRNPAVTSQILVLVAVALVGGWAIANWPVPLLFAGPAILWLARKRIPPILASPVWIVVSFLTIATAAGYAIYGTQSPSTRLLFLIDSQLADQTLVIVSISTASIAFGAYLATLIGHPFASTTGFSLGDVKPRARLAIVAVAVFPLLFAVTVVDSLYSRTSYLQQTEGSFTGVLGTATLAGLVALGYLIRSSRPSTRIVFGVIVFVEVVILFSLASRQFAMAPLAFAFGAFIFRTDRFGKGLLVAAAFASILLVPIPLYLRGLPIHGIAEYLPALSSMTYDWEALKDAIGNITIGFPVTGLTAYRSNPIGLEEILISINPLPGTIAGWYEISARMRLGINFPYSAIGEAWNAGALIAVPLFVGIGVVLGHLDSRVRLLSNQGRQFVAFTICGLAVLSGLLMSQYNLRNATRPLWYAVAIDLISRVPLTGRGRLGGGTGSIRIQRSVAGPGVRRGSAEP